MYFILCIEKILDLILLVVNFLEDLKFLVEIFL